MIVAGLAALAGAAAADPPTEEVAKRAAATWFAAARNGDAATLSRASARGVRVSIDQMGCGITTTAATRRDFAKVAKRLAGCHLLRAPAAWWRPAEVSGDTRTVGFMTDDETFLIVAVTVDAGGRVIAASVRTSWGGPGEGN